MTFAADLSRTKRFALRLDDALSKGPLKPLVAVLPVVTAIALFVYQVLKFCKDSRFFVDDPFISMRFAANLLRYGELSFNPGVRVEGYSNLLHVLIHAATFKILGKIPDAATGINGVVAIVFLSALGQLLGLYVLGARKAQSQAASTAWYYAWIVTMSGLPFAFWAAAGLETPIEGLLYVLVACVAVRVTRLSPSNIALLGVLLFGVTLVRFEGVLVATAVACVIALSAWRGQDLLRKVSLLFAVAIPGLVYHSFRLLYFRRLLPNTYIAKATGGSVLGRLNAGMHYCGNWMALIGAGLAVVAILIAVIALHRQKTGPAEPESQVVALDVPVSATLVVVKLLLVSFGGGDWMPGFRMLVPITPFALYLVFKLLLSATHEAARVRPYGAIAVGFALAIPFVVRGVPFNGNNTEMSDTAGLKNIPSSYSEMGLMLKAHFRGREEVAIGEAGLIPYEAIDVRFLDMFGLVDEDMARQPGGMHQRVHCAHLMDRNPVAVVFAHLTTEPPYGPYQYGPELLTSGQFHANYRRVTMNDALSAVGWALYVKRTEDIAARGLSWAPTDPFLTISNDHADVRRN